MDLTTYSLEQLKTLHNTTLAEARENAEMARACREEIEARENSYRGRSRGQLAEAIASLFTARTFANTPHDLPLAENAYRNR